MKKITNLVYNVAIAAIGLLLVIGVIEDIAIGIGLIAIVFGAYKVVVSLTK